MKRILYMFLLVAVLVFCGSCSNDDLPEANFELFQLETVIATAGDRAATISWTTQEADGVPESFLLSWVAGSKDVAGGEMELSSDLRSVVIEGLTNNVAYTFSVQGRYTKGLSMKVSSSSTPKSIRFPVTELLCAAGSGKVRLTWVKPASDKLTGYRIVTSPGDKIITLNTPDTDRYVVEGLSNGVKYEFMVMALYTNGDSEGATAEAIPGAVLPITVATTEVGQSQPITFTCNDMYFLHGEIESVVWTFGDGKTSTDEKPTHRFTVAGNYKVDVTVTYVDQTTDSGSLEITVIGFRWSSVALINGSYTGAVKSSNPVFSPDGSTAYIPTSNKRGDLFALNVYTGEIKWAYAISGVTYGGGAAVGNDGSIYQGAQDKKMYAIKANGMEKWTYTSSGSIENFPAITSDNKLYFGANGTKSVTFYSLNATTGAVLWSKEIDGTIASAVAVDVDGHAYIGTNTAIYSFTASGDERWKSSEVVNTTERGSFAISGSTLYTALRGGDGVAAVSMSTGAVLWRSGQATGDSYFPIVDKQGVVYFTDKGSATIFAFNADGTQKWSAASGSALIYSGLVLSSDGQLYIGTQKTPTRLLGLDAATGSIVLDEGSEQIMSALSIGPDNRLYFGSVPGRVAAREISAGLEIGSWSVRGGNMQGTNSLK